MELTYFGDNVADLRKKAGISQEEFADKLKVSRQAVSKWERNEAYPDTENLIAIAKFFDVTIDDLIHKNLTDNSEFDSVESETEIVIEEKTEDEEVIERVEEDYSAKCEKEKLSMGFWMSLPYPIVITVIYLIWGLCFDGFYVGWTLYVTIPLYYTLFPALKRKRIEIICYPAFVTFIFLLFGIHYG